MPKGTTGLPVQVVVTVDIDTLRDQLGTAESLGAGLIGASTARRLACDAKILPAVLGSDSVPLDLGRTTRVITPGQRAAVALRDGRCRWPGCTHTIENVHHIDYWANGGSTDLHNLIGLCVAHHKKIHERNFLLVGNANETVAIHSPPTHDSRRHFISNSDPPKQLGSIARARDSRATVFSRPRHPD